MAGKIERHDIAHPEHPENPLTVAKRVADAKKSAAIVAAQKTTEEVKPKVPERK